MDGGIWAFQNNKYKINKYVIQIPCTRQSILSPFGGQKIV